MLPLISPSDIVSNNALIVILKFIGQRDVKYIMTLPIKINNVSFEGLNITLSLISQLVHRTRLDISANVCLELQN